MGLNPHRQYRRKGPIDVIIVAGATLCVLALVAWAFLG
jgi:hypothetical protein